MAIREMEGVQGGVLEGVVPREEIEPTRWRHGVDQGDVDGELDEYVAGESDA